MSGTPSAAGGYNFTLLLTDATGGAAGYATSVTILPQLVASGTCTKFCAVEAGCVTVCGGFGSVSGGLQPYAYKLASGSIPAGMNFSGLALTGTFPSPAGTYPFTVAVTDAMGAAVTVDAVFGVSSHIALAGGACYGNFGTGCTVSLPISGGLGTPTVTLVSVAQNPTPDPPPNAGTCWTLSATAPPSGYTLTAGGGNVTVTIPASLINGYGAVWTLIVTDQALCGPGPTYCSSPDATVPIGVQCG